MWSIYLTFSVFLFAALVYAYTYTLLIFIDLNDVFGEGSGIVKGLLHTTLFVAYVVFVGHFCNYLYNFLCGL